jgi:hypothetical protein
VVAAGHPEHIALTALAQVVAALRVAAQLIVTRDLTMRDVFTPQVEHLHTLVGSRVVLHLLRPMAGVASLLIPGPFLGKVQPEVEQGVIVARDVPHVDAHLAVVHLPRWPRHWRFTPTEWVPPLGKLLESKAIMPSGSPNRSATWPTNTVINGR